MQEAKIRKLHEEHKKLHGKNGLEYPSFRSRIHKGWDTKKAVNTARQFDRNGPGVSKKTTTINMSEERIQKENIIEVAGKTFFSQHYLNSAVKDNEPRHIAEFLSKILKERPNEIAIGNDDSEKVTYISSESVDDIMSKMKNSVLDDHAIDIVNKKPETIFIADPRNSGDKPLVYFSESKFLEMKDEIQQEYYLSIGRRFAIALLAGILVIAAYSIASSIHPLLFK